MKERKTFLNENIVNMKNKEQHLQHNINQSSQQDH